MDAAQQDIRFEWLTKEVSLSASAKNPRFWIQDLLLLSKFKDPKNEVIRHFRLQRGLNILWAKPFDPESENGAAVESVTGHAAGKTLFCRMLRYLLGEKHLGNELVKDRVAANFPDGWAIGTVFIGETPWLVARPFAGKQGQFCIQGMTVDEWLENPLVEHEHYKVFEKALNHVVIGSYAVTEFPDRKGSIHFQHLLPWLTRDQEARYGGITQWRESSSGAEPMGTDSEERHFLMRATMGLIHPDEKAELDHNAALVRDREKLRTRQPILQDRIEQNMKQLKEGLAVAGLDQEFIETITLQDDLLIDSIETRLNQKLKNIKDLFEEIPSEADIAELQSQLTTRTEARVGLENELNTINTRLTATNTDWGSLGKQQEVGNMQEHVDKLDMPTGHCGAPIGVAKQHNCRLYQEWSNIALDKETGDLNMDVINAQYKEKVALIEAEITAKKTEIKKAKATEESALKALTEANQKRLSLTTHIQEKENTFKALIEKAKLATTAFNEDKGSESKIVDFDEKIKSSYRKQQKIRDQQKTSRQQFSEYFDQICKHILGKEVLGHVSFKTRQLDLAVDDRGPLTSAAIETVKVLALDLAALWHSIEGHGHYPSFLIHDGPREADMDAWMYRRLFTFVHKLEEAYVPERQPAFQYIITTTEPPPKEFQQEPWLIHPILSARKPEERLLGIDLR